MGFKTDYKDDIINTTSNEKRQYEMIQNDNGTVSFNDVTVYEQVGDTLGAKELNEISEKLNISGERIRYNSNNDMVQILNDDGIWEDWSSGVSATALIKNGVIISEYSSYEVRISTSDNFLCVNAPSSGSNYISFRFDFKNYAGKYIKIVAKTDSRSANIIITTSGMDKIYFDLAETEKSLYFPITEFMKDSGALKLSFAIGPNIYIKTIEITASDGTESGGGSDDVELTQAEYDALPDTKLTDNKNYFIKDAIENNGNLVRNGISYSGGGVDIESEVIDIRLKADGTTATSAGNAVREQITELKGDLDNKIDKPTSADNNKFPRAKDGNVEWVEQGLPTDSQTENAVNNWLNEHPEATTTVQDGSLTEEKINADFLPYIKNNYFTPEMYGAVGDGLTDDTLAIAECFKHENVSLSKKYLVNSALVVQSTNVELNNSTILFDGTPNNDTFITFEKTFTKVNGGNINANGFKNAITFNEHRCAIDNVRVFGFTECAFLLTKNIQMAHIRIEGNGSDESYGILTTSSDSTFESIVIVDCKIGVKINGGGNNRFANIHPWLTKREYFENSYCVVVDSYAPNVFDKVTCDTVQTAFKLARNYTILNASDCIIFNNVAILDDTQYLLSNNPSNLSQYVHCSVIVQKQNKYSEFKESQSPTLKNGTLKIVGNYDNQSIVNTIVRNEEIITSNLDNYILGMNIYATTASDKPSEKGGVVFGFGNYDTRYVQIAIDLDGKMYSRMRFNGNYTSWN